MTLDPEAGQRLRVYMEPRIGKVLPWAERHGIGRDTIYALWRGRDPQPATMRTIADALGISYDELLRVRAGIETPPTAETVEGELAAAIRELTTELRASRQARDSDETRLRAVEAELVALRALVGGAASQGRHVPPATGG